MSSLLSQLGAIGVTLTPVFRLLIDTALKGSILIALAAVAIYFLRGKAAAARHAVWTAAVVGHLALPLMTLVVPAWRIPLLPAPSWIDAPASVRASISAGKESVGVAPISTTPTVDAAPAQDKRVAPAIPSPVNRSPANRSMVERNTVNPSAPSSPLHVAAVLGFLWISGSFLVLLRLAIGTWRVGKLAKNGDRVDDGEWLSLTQRVAKRLGITRPLTLLRGDSLAVPVTWGVVYPAVLLPPDAAEWPEARRRFVLVHEMAHVKRFDALTQLIAQVTIAILWFDPLIWLAAHRMRVEREHACDDYVLRDGTAASLYAGELLEMVQAIGSPRHEHAAPAFAALAMARRSEFEGRMLAILDPRQNRRTLGRASTILASAVLALLVIPLAALRPFESHADSAVASAASAMRRGGISPAVATPAAASSARLARKIGDTACDSVKRLAGVTTSTHIHIDDDDKSDQRIIEFLNSSAGYCSQAVVLGAAKFADDRLAALSAGSFASFRELTSGGDRIVRVIPAYGGQLEYIASFNGRQVPYDDEMRRWMQRFVPEVLRETGVDVPQRVKRDMARGGLSLVLSNIRRTKSTSSKRAHYLALLDSIRLTDAQYSDVLRHAASTLSGSSSDLTAVLTHADRGGKGTRSLGAAIGRLAEAQKAMGAALGSALKANESSAESAGTMTEYASTDDPEMILMALRGAKNISSDTDRRTLLETLAPRALRRINPTMRTAFFEAAAVTESDTDRRAILLAALRFAHGDKRVALAVFQLVAKMTSDTDKRAVLSKAAEQRLLSTAELRAAFMNAAKTIESSTDYTAVMQAALRL